MGDVFLLSLTAALNPTLLAASTLMMLLPNAKRLMLGYLLGAMLTSITLGLVIVFSLEGSRTVSTTQHTLSPAATLTLGGIALLLAFVLGSDRTRVRGERRRERKQQTGPPRWQRGLERGSPRVTFVIGAALTLPGASYLAGLHRIDTQNLSTAATVAVVIAFNLVMLALLEVPLLGFAIAPDWTVRSIHETKALLERHGRAVAARALAIVGVLLVIKGTILLLS